MASFPLRAPSLRRRAAMLQAAAAVVLCVLAAAVLLSVGAARLRGQVRTIEASQNEAARHAFAFRLDADADGGRRIRDRLSNGARGTDALFGSYRRRVWAAIEAERAAFERLDMAVRARGYSEDEGAEGDLRRAAHAIETDAQGSGDVLLERDLLALRRHEKDFLLRGRPVYVEQTVRAAERLRRQIGASALGPAHRARMFGHLDRYEAAFARLAAGVQGAEADWEAFEAAQQRSRAEVEAAERAADAMLFFALALLGVTGATCAVGYAAQTHWVARHVIRPLRDLHDAALTLAQSGEAAPPEDQRYQEFDDLGQALVAASDHLRERRRAEADADRARQSIRAALDSIDDAVLVYDRHHHVRLANPAAVALLGLSPADLAGRSLREVIDASQSSVDFDFAAAHDRFERALRGETVVSPDVELRHASTGASGWYSTTYTPLAGPTGAPAGVVARIYDLTRRKAEERALDRARQAAEAAQATAEEAMQFKSALLNNLSHEIRTPLAGLLGYLDVLRDDEFRVPHVFLDDMQVSAHRLRDTLTGLLELARLEADGEPPHPEPVDVRAEAEAALRGVRLAAGRKGLTLVLDAPAAPVEAFVSRVVVRAALGNLLDNALKFTAAGTVTVRIARDRDRVVLDVLDTGTGMAAAFLPRAFEAFRQESSGMDRRHEGAGLGLAITRRLVEAAGGTIEVESVPGEGSRFRVVLPALPEATQAATGPAGAWAPGLRQASTAESLEA